MFSTSINNSDLQNLQKFSSAIKVTDDGLTKSQRITKAWNENMTGCSMAAKRAGNDLINGKKSIKDISTEMQNGSKSTVGFTAKMVAMNVGISLLISGIFKLTSYIGDKLVNSLQDAEEKSLSFSNAVNEFSKNVSSNSKTLSELNTEYQTLSKGVNSLGENVSLSTSQYNRYKDIISQVSEIMPNLTTYFNAQGEKIAFAKGNLTDLNKEYEKYIQTQAKSFLSEGDEDGNTFKDVLDDYANNEKHGFWANTWRKLKGQFSYLDISDIPQKEAIAELKKLANKSQKEVSEILDSSDSAYSMDTKHTTKSDQIKHAIRTAIGADSKSISEMTEEEFNVIQQQIMSQISSLEDSIDVDMSKITSGLIQYAYSKDSFWDIPSSDIRNNIITFLSSISNEVWDELGVTTSNEASVFVDKIITLLSTNKDGFAEAWNGLFALNDENLPVDEYIAKVNSFIDIISKALGLDETGKRELLITLGFDIDGLEKSYNNAIAEVQKKFSKDEIKKQLEGYNQEDTIDFTVRPVIDTSKLKDKGWDDVGEGTATVFSSTYYSEDFGLEEGKALVVTPILPDGTVLSPEDLNEYARKILNGEEVDVDIKMGMFDGENYKAEADEFANTIHELHEQYFDDSYIDWNKYFKDQSIDTQEELNKWNEVTEGCHTAAEAMKAWENAAKAAAKATEITLKSVSDAKKGLDSLFDSYEKDMELTADEVSEILQENPQYIQYLTKVGDKYKVNQKALEDWNKVQEEQQRLVDIQMGSNVYATQYNPTLDGVSDISTKDYTGTGNWESGKQALDELIAKNKELNQSFADGKISAAEYFTSLSDSITNSGLEQALDDIGGKFDETTDYIEGTVSVLASELSDALIQANKRYTLGKTSVGDYADELMASIEVQKKLLKSTYDLEDANDGYVKTVEDTNDANKKAADSFNEIVDASKELEIADKFADSMESYNDEIMKYVDGDGVTLTEGILGDPDLLEKHMDNVTDMLVDFANTSDENMEHVANQVANSLGIEQAAAEQLIKEGGDAIQTAAVQNMDAINGLTQASMSNTQATITSASQAIGNILSALGDAISNFDYTISITPEGSIDMGSIIDMVKGEVNPTGEVKLHFSGSGGENVKNFADTLKNAGNFFSKDADKQASTFAGYGSKNNTNAAGKRPTSSGSGSGSGGSGKSGDDDANASDENMD